MGNRRWMAGMVAVLCVSSAWPCGDKLSVMGGGVRYDRIKQVRVSGRVVIYAPQNSQLRAAIDEFDLTTRLARTGLDVHVIEQPDDLRRELTLADTDLVLTDLSFFESVDAERGKAAILPVSYGDAAAFDSKSRCVARVTKRNGRQFVRAVELILERRSRGISFDCGTDSQSEPI